MIERTEVTAATCDCGKVDYAPVEDTALESLPGLQVEIIHQDMVEKGYACKVAHVSRVAKRLAEKLYGELHPKPEKDIESTDGKADDDTGLLAS